MKNVIYLFLFCIPLIAADSLQAQSFTRVESQVGLDVVSKNNGVAVADYDQDGHPDLFFTGFHSFDPNDESSWNRMMRNRGDGTFEDVTLAAGFTHQFVNTEVTASLGEKMGASWGDYDNDGFPDLFLTNSRLDQLYHNNGDGTFTDVTAVAGVAGCHSCYSGGAIWLDHDRDGDLDLYVSNLKGTNFLYENKGDGTFEDIADRVGAAGDEYSVSWTSLALDAGKDGFLDIYSANDTQINEFFENRSGTHYNESSRAYRLSDEGAGMGMSIGDFNNDGLFDIYVTNIYNHLPNPLFENLGTRRYKNVAAEMGVDNTGWGWGTHFFDCDLDGDEDLAAVNGVVSKQNIGGVEQQDVNNFFFKNTLMETGQAGFIDWSAESGTNGHERARGLEVFDYDGDGDLDMVVANVESTPYFFENNEVREGKASSHNWLQVKLEGTVSNRSAFGTEVKITMEGKSIYRWHHGGGFFSQSIKPVHFGVGTAGIIDELQITWLSGRVETFYAIPVNQTVKVVEGAGLTHTESPFTDQRLKLLQNYPNPFGELTQWEVELEEAGDLQLTVYSLLGQKVFSESYPNLGAGQHSISWEGRDVPPGTYFYLIDVDGAQRSGKLMKR